MLKRPRMMNQAQRVGSKQSGAFVRHRRERLVIGVGAVVISVVALVFTLSRLTMLPALSISGVAVEGAHPSLVAAVEQAALTSVSGRYLGLFSRANGMIYPRKQVETSVAASVPQIASAEVSLRGLRTLVVTVTEREPEAVVCAGLPDFDGQSLMLDTAQACSFADADGRLYGQSPSFSGTSYKRYYAPVSDGIVATSTDEFHELQEFYDAVRRSGIGAEAILIKEGGEYELYLRNASTTAAPGGGTAVVYFNHARSFSEQLDNLVSFWTRMAEQAKAKRESLAFEYIDVRYGSNVFYRVSR